MSVTRSPRDALGALLALLSPEAEGTDLSDAPSRRVLSGRCASPGRRSPALPDPARASVGRRRVRPLCRAGGNPECPVLRRPAGAGCSGAGADPAGRRLRTRRQSRVRVEAVRAAFLSQHLRFARVLRARRLRLLRQLHSDADRLDRRGQRRDALGWRGRARHPRSDPGRLLPLLQQDGVSPPAQSRPAAADRTDARAVLPEHHRARHHVVTGLPSTQHRAERGSVVQPRLPVVSRAPVHRDTECCAISKSTCCRVCWRTR
jgi:hypothetical protein